MLTSGPPRPSLWDAHIVWDVRFRSCLALLHLCFCLTSLPCAHSSPHFSLIPWWWPDVTLFVLFVSVYRPSIWQYSGKSHGQRSQGWGCSPWGRKESDVTESPSLHLSCDWFSLVCYSNFLLVCFSSLKWNLWCSSEEEARPLCSMGLVRKRPGAARPQEGCEPRLL